MQKYLVEFIGTFFLVATIGFCVIAPAASVPPLAIGSVLMVMIFAGGHVSGAHYNPAVTLAVFLRGKCDKKDVVPYMIAQVAAAAAAAAIVIFVKGQPTKVPENLDIVKSLIVEFLYTFALCYTVLNVATAKGTLGNMFYGLAIGFMVLAGAFAVGGISGGAFNPAVAVALPILNLVKWTDIWIFLVANFAAAVVAALVFRVINPDDV